MASGVTPYIIAEMGIGHNGSLDRALGMVYLASHHGASAVKTQFWSDPAALRRRMHSEDSPADLEGLRTREEWLPILRDAAKGHHMDFLCTVDLFEDIAIVAQYVDKFKIASWGATDVAFIAAHRRYGKSVILSVGTVTAEELNVVRRCVVRPPDALLHCVSAYPAELFESNLRVIQSEFLDGFSDHTGKTITGALAVAAGAKILEVHYRAEDTPLSNPDYLHSLSPEDLRLYIGLAKTAARAMGDGVKRVTMGERPFLKHRYLRP